MADATVTLEGSGTIALSTTASESAITLGDRVVALNVYLDDTADGTFGINSSAAGAQVPLPNQVWVEVYRREDREQNTGQKVVYFAAASGTPNLSYRVTG